MEVEYPETVYLNHAGGTLDDSSGGWAGTVWYAFAFNTSTAYYFYNEQGLSTTYERLYTIATSKRSRYKFLGWYSDYNGVTTQIYDASGSLVYTGNLGDIGATASLYAQWQLVTWEVTLSKNGGTGGPDTIQYNFTNSRWYLDGYCQEQTTNVEPPTKENYVFTGYWNGSTKCINADGTFVSGFVPTASMTLTAGWEFPCPRATISKNSGTGGTDTLYYNAADGKWYLDYPFVTELSATNPITPPTYSCHGFIGCYKTNSSSGVQYIDADGAPTAAFLALTPTSDITIYARWQQICYSVTFNHSSGSPTKTVIYYKISGGGLYSDDTCTTAISSVTPPTRELWRWDGAWDKSKTTSGAAQLINADGSFTSSLTSKTFTANTTFNYANYWTQLSVKLTLSGTSWTIATKTYYIDKTNGGVYSDYLLTTPLTSLPIPVRTAYRFLGYYSTNATTGTLYVAADGTIQSALQSRKAATTIYAQGRAATYTLTLDPNGGTTTEPTLYYDATSGATAFFGADSATTTTVDEPTYSGNSFLGYFTAESGGTQVIDASGNILSSWVPTANDTVYAQWGIDVSIISVDAGEGSGGTAKFYYQTSTGKFYADSELEEEITSVTLPTKRLFDTDGLYTDGGVMAVNSSGVIQSSFAPSGEFVNLSATYTRRCYETTINAAGGEAAVSAIYRAPSGSTWYREDTLTTAITNVGVPVRAGHTFGGCYYGDTLVISSTGAILSAAAANEDYAAMASWTAKTYTLNFHASEGTPSFSQKTVTFGQAIGALPTVVGSLTLEAWVIRSNEITASSVWSYDSDMTAEARFVTPFGGVTDFFSLGGDVLFPVSSNDGERRVTIETSHTGALSIGDTNPNGAYMDYGTLFNPTVTYGIRMSGSVTVELGKAFSYAGKKYMLVSARLETGADKEPRLVVKGHENEGADAINRWSVALAVKHEHVTQEPFAAVSGGGEHVSCDTEVVCEPVVCYEDALPCASDVVHGKVSVRCRTAAYDGEGAPTAASPFKAKGEPQARGDTDFTVYDITAERSL